MTLSANECDKRTFAILRHEFCEAVHWYAISNEVPFIQEKFVSLEDAKTFALLHALPENIEVSD